MKSAKKKKSRLGIPCGHAQQYLNLFFLILVPQIIKWAVLFPPCLFQFIFDLFSLPWKTTWKRNVSNWFKHTKTKPKNCMYMWFNG